MPMNETYPDGEGTLVGFIDKSGGERLYVGTREYLGYRFIDLRTYYDSKGTWKPSKKGVTLPVVAFSELSEVVRDLGEHLGLG